MESFCSSLSFSICHTSARVRDLHSLVVKMLLHMLSLHMLSLYTLLLSFGLDHESKVRPPPRGGVVAIACLLLSCLLSCLSGVLERHSGDGEAASRS